MPWEGGLPTRISFVLYAEPKSSGDSLDVPMDVRVLEGFKSEVPKRQIEIRNDWIRLSLWLMP
jgi:hypothetical protein